MMAITTKSSINVKPGRRAAGPGRRGLALSIISVPRRQSRFQVQPVRKLRLLPVGSDRDPPDTSESGVQKVGCNLSINAAIISYSLVPRIRKDRSRACNSRIAGKNCDLLATRPSEVKAIGKTTRLQRVGTR